MCIPYVHIYPYNFFLCSFGSPHVEVLRLFPSSILRDLTPGGTWVVIWGGAAERICIGHVKTNVVDLSYCFNHSNTF